MSSRKWGKILIGFLCVFKKTVKKVTICNDTTLVQMNTTLKFVQKVVLYFVIYYGLQNEKLCCILIP